jgi:uncharacterized membrane protein YdjX (TVP38/TMEM64 family)
MAKLVGAVGGGCALFFSTLTYMKPTAQNIKKLAKRFIIDGIITMPIALYGFLIFPDLPATTKAFYLSEDVSLFDPRLSFSLRKSNPLIVGASISIRTSRGKARQRASQIVMEHCKKSAQ